jgi:hypothetical protein
LGRGDRSVTTERRRRLVPLTKGDAHRRVRQLVDLLRPIVKSDSEQEVTGMAMHVIDAAFEAARTHLADDDPLVRRSLDVISPEMIEAGEPLRALDALIVADQLEAALFEPPQLQVTQLKRPGYRR